MEESANRAASWCALLTTARRVLASRHRNRVGEESRVPVSGLEPVATDPHRVASDLPSEEASAAASKLKKRAETVRLPPLFAHYETALRNARLSQLAVPQSIGESVSLLLQ